uniref:Uncharacterized protein n=1 Tax=Lepeophtheirus salmonis TaxID=72036 RepID=A0A0K2TJV7_LEPSM
MFSHILRFHELNMDPLQDFVNQFVTFHTQYSSVIMSYFKERFPCTLLLIVGYIPANGLWDKKPCR